MTNGFTDLHIAYGRGSSPATTRLGNPWRPLDGDPAGPGMWTASGGAGRAIHTVRVAGWRFWALGDLYGYRVCGVDVLERFAAEVADGGADPRQLDFHGLVWAWREETRHLHIWTDRLGTGHLFRVVGRGRTVLGTVRAAVAESSTRSLDWVGITGFIGFGFYPGTRTMFEDLEIIRPATETVLDEDGLTVSEQRYWNWSFDPQHGRSDDDLLEEFQELWYAVLRDQYRDHRLGMPISGGLDSRMITADSLVCGTDPGNIDAFTYGYSPRSIEIRIGRWVARACGIPVREWVVDPYLIDRVDEITDALDGISSLASARQAAFSNRLQSVGDRIVAGHWGDVWFDTSGVHGSDTATTPAGMVGHAMGAFAKRGRQPLLDQLCAPHLDHDPDTVLRDLVADELARIPDVGDPDMRLKMLKTEQWSFRWTLASLRAYSLAVPVVLPFYANDVVDFFLRVPTDRLPRRRLQIAYLRRFHPEAAAVRWQESGMSLNERPWEPAWEVTRRAAAKAKRIAFRESVLQRNWEVQFLDEQERNFVSRLEALIAGRADIEALSSVIDPLLETPDAGTGYAADAALTLAAALHEQSR